VALLLFGTTKELNCCRNTWSQAWGRRIKYVRPRANWYIVFIRLMRNEVVRYKHEFTGTEQLLLRLVQGHEYSTPYGLPKYTRQHDNDPVSHRIRLTRRLLKSTVPLNFCSVFSRCSCFFTALPRISWQQIYPSLYSFHEAISEKLVTGTVFQSFLIKHMYEFYEQ
jgi:hypothetical protein